MMRRDVMTAMTGRRAIVTGGSNGIGVAIALTRAAGLVLFPASPAADFINGACIPLEGGLSMAP
jgi:NAD(P)-dependent dehydrogenase (short-subunit alcohol dehydrogenase family)